MALQFSRIDPLHAATRAVARTPLVKPPSKGSSTAPASMAAELAAASANTTTAAPSTPLTTSGGNSLLPPTVATTPTPAPLAGPPTTQSVFGSNPWLTDPTGTGPSGGYPYNPEYFATPQAAATVASMVGGTVVQVNAMGGPSANPFVQSQPNEMVQLANGAIINPGLVASFYTHGYPQSMVNQMIANEVANVSSGT